MNDSAKQLHPGLAIAALVLGISSLVMSFFVIGAVFGLIGLVLGVVYLRIHRTEPRGMAISGIVLSIVGTAGGIAFGAMFFIVFSNLSRLTTAGPSLQVWEGVEAPDFAVTTMNGQTVALSELRGKRVVVDFWATWCGPCVREIPHYNRLAQETSADELIVLGISKEPPAVIEPFLEEHAVAYPTVSTTDLPAPYSSVRAIPTTFFIDRNGVIQSVLRGYRDYDVLEQHALTDDYGGVARSTCCD